MMWIEKNMNNFLYNLKNMIFFANLIILASCEQNIQYTENTIQTKNTNTIKDSLFHNSTFIKVNNRAVLLGDTIKLLDNIFNEIKDISYLKEQLVIITEVSEKLHKEKPTDNYCNEFKYVKIKTKDIEGYVDGRKVYALIEQHQNKTLLIDNNEISFVATNYFGVGVSDSVGLTECRIYTPVIFSDKNEKYEGIVKMIFNKKSESTFPYFELKNDDGASDKIAAVEKQGEKYLLHIKRFHQVDEANILVAIYKDKTGKFVAEILENNQTID